MKINLGNKDTIGEATQLVKDYLAEQKISYNISNRVTKALFEAEANAIIHGADGYVEVALNKTFLEICIKDFGKGIECIETALQEGYSTAQTDSLKSGFGAGIGLTVVRKNADEFNLTSIPGSETCLSLKFKLD